MTGGCGEIKGGAPGHKNGLWHACFPSVARPVAPNFNQLAFRAADRFPLSLKTRTLCPNFEHKAAGIAIEAGARQDEFDERRGAGDRPRSRA
jgi:hypothetical protein